MNTWTYIKADSFFLDLLPEIKNYKRKIAGTNTKGKPLEFSQVEIKQINTALKKIPDLYLWRYVKAERFFTDYLPDIKNFKRKISGLSSRGDSLDFSEQEKKLIKKSVAKMVRESLL
ncbi:hypothetical protein [Agriterribacter sp.]|uniref:hypothetical protein n=1 Tax=Agriterribacter sp. TaxID=2821509 RepID=UPI002B866907|nr:hypothetical protein [Agriterribacter sp.]HTN09212.1 hypothetical protein [Agriterribacter sp.]